MIRSSRNSYQTRLAYQIIVINGDTLNEIEYTGEFKEKKK
jgi:hypothetical protein